MAELGGRRHRVNWQLIGALGVLLIVASAAYAARQLMHGGLHAGDTASLLGLPLGVAGLVTAVVSLRRPIEGNDAEVARGWARTLARQVKTDESRTRGQLLGDDTERINLAYVLHPATVRSATAPAAGRTFTDSPVAVPDITAYYRSTRPGRLVITGTPGAGKTVLALELLLNLIEARDDDDPVPVRVPLNSWDTEQPLDALLTQRLVDAYDWPLRMAEVLIAQGMVLPVLDGLDEMDPLHPDGTPDSHPPRATSALNALDAYQDGLNPAPFILTSRADHYDALAQGFRLRDAARIAIAPVDTDQAWTYLYDRARDPLRWQPLLDRLAAHPGGTMAALMSTPWRLCLVATVYHREGDPSELLAHRTPAGLDDYLLARYIPAAVSSAPNPRHYRTGEVDRWLRQIAVHLNSPRLDTAGTPASTSGTDLTLHQLWPLAGRSRVRMADALLTTLTVLLALPLTVVGGALTGYAAVVVLFAVLAGVLALGTHSPRRLNWNRLRTAAGRRTVMVSLGTGLGIGLTIVPSAGLAVGLPVGLLIGAAISLAFGLQGEPTAAANPRATMRGDIVYGLVLILAGTIVGGLLGGPPGQPPDSLADGLACGLSAGLAFGLTRGLASARRYTVFLLCSRRRLPFRLAHFLDWAASAGLLRYSGPSYQYRHRELQQWLARQPIP
ncbi:NACHT domain-containing protein [Streptomyces sp. NPDC029004]|uniref:NACHT domain-containing protein n=1 Tax=Streptomyces sp. NPDC029004 TaxID=3154490 RepID=UPI0033F50144